jgi:CubicO group peptidase (beta-lactamase class C family)
MAIELPRTRALLEEGIARKEQLGAQLAISRGAERAELTLGERQQGQEMTADTLNIWLSTTKPLTAAAFAILWQRGKADLDDRVASVIPEFGNGGKEAITIRHLLTHTAGIRMLNVGWPEASWDEILAKICAARIEPRWVPGKKAGYHLASSFFVLGEVIARLAGKPFRDFVRRELFEKLGMENCFIGMPEERWKDYGDRIGRMYSTEQERVMPRSWHNLPHTTGSSPGGNGYGPMNELILFYEMLLRHGKTRSGEKLLEPQTVEALVSPQRVGMVDLTFQTKIDFGLGFIVNSRHYGAELLPYGYGSHAGRRTFGHSGHQSSTAFADPENDLAVALFVNGQPGEPRHTHRFRELVDAIYEDLNLAVTEVG